jgi:peptide chain release factor
MNNIILQITSGRGPAECCWVVAQVLKAMMEEARNSGLQVTVIQREKGLEPGTLLAASVEIKGQSLNAFSKEWLGSILWIGQSSYRKFHKRKNWFVGVYRILNEAKDDDVNIADVKFEFTRSRGPGGQNVNKVSTAVRATHVASGVVVTASENRTQHQNKQLAIDKLNAKLRERTNKMMSEQAEAQWQNHNQLERGNPVRVFETIRFKPKKRI